jgi:4-hydroxy-tetrahydrodipicolinate reductase
MIRVALNGGGRMAASIVTVAADEAGMEVTALVAPERPDWLRNIPWHPRLRDLVALPDVLIDFSLPEGTRMAAQWCGRAGVPLLSGVTGLTPAAKTALERASAHVAVLWSPNLSLGVNLLEALCRRTAATLAPDAQVRIHDVHHQWKKDAPSGTALMLGAAIEASRPAGSAPVRYSAEREGEVIGRHEVRFEFGGEVLEFTHTALDRGIFARGAVDAARWLSGQPPGRYHATDWLLGRLDQVD